MYLHRCDQHEWSVPITAGLHKCILKEIPLKSSGNVLQNSACSYVIQVATLVE